MEVSLERKKQDQELSWYSESFRSALQDKVTSSDLSTTGCRSPLATRSLIAGDSREFRTKEDCKNDAENVTHTVIKEEVIELEGSPEEETVGMREAIGGIFNPKIEYQTIGVDDAEIVMSEKCWENINEHMDIENITYENNEHEAIDGKYLDFDPVNNCNKGYKQLHSKELKIHKEFVHHKHMCNELGCGRTFISTTNLQDHMRCVHQQAKVKCKEPSCSARFNSMSVLYSHMRKKHGGNIGCEQPGCTEAFTFQREYNSHIRKQHTVMHELKCKYCEYTTSKGEKYMMVHNKKEHKENKYIGLNKGQIMEIKKEKEHWMKKKTQKCTQCENVYRCKRELSDHMRSKHGEPRLQCHLAGCYATFTKRANLIKHVKKHMMLETTIVDEEIEVKQKLREDRMKERVEKRGDRFQDTHLFPGEATNNNMLKEEV